MTSTPTPPDSNTYAWKPNVAQPWPNQVNEQLSRHGIGLEEMTRKVQELEQNQLMFIEVADLMGKGYKQLYEEINALKTRLLLLEGKTL